MNKFRELLDRQPCRHCQQRIAAYFNNSNKAFYCQQCVEFYALDENYLTTAVQFRGAELFVTRAAEDCRQVRAAISGMFESHKAALGRLERDLLRDVRGREQHTAQAVIQIIDQIEGPKTGESMEQAFFRVLDKGKSILKLHQQNHVELQCLAENLVTVSNSYLIAAADSCRLIYEKFIDEHPPPLRIEHEQEHTERARTFSYSKVGHENVQPAVERQEAECQTAELALQMGQPFSIAISRDKEQAGRRLSAESA